MVYVFPMLLVVRNESITVVLLVYSWFPQSQSEIPRGYVLCNDLEVSNKKGLTYTLHVLLWYCTAMCYIQVGIRRKQYVAFLLCPN
jgi:hypothetical protein